MKMLHVTPTFYPDVGGIEDVIHNIAKISQVSGYDVDVAHVSSKFSEYLTEDYHGYKVHRIPIFGHRLFGVSFKLISLLKDYDLVHVHDPQLAALSINVLVGKKGIPAFLSTHGGFFHTKSSYVFKKIYWHTFAKLIGGRFDRILASSKSDFDRYSEIFDNISLAENGVNTTRFPLVNGKVSETSWVYWGRLATNKRIDSVLLLISDLKRIGIDIDFRVVGRDFDGTERVCKELANELGINHRVNFLGGLSNQELTREISNCSIFITGSEYEGFGLSVIEAIGAGLYVVCRDIEPLNSFVSGQNGCLLEFDRSEADVERTVSLMKRALEHQCRNVVSNTVAAYDWKYAFKAYEKVYNEYYK